MSGISGRPPNPFFSSPGFLGRIQVAKPRIVPQGEEALNVSECGFCMGVKRPYLEMLSCVWEGLEPQIRG